MEAARDALAMQTSLDTTIPNMERPTSEWLTSFAEQLVDAIWVDPDWEDVRVFGHTDSNTTSDYAYCICKQGNFHS